VVLMDNRKKICIKLFKQYVKNFDKKIPAIKMKYYHSFKVSKLSEKIGRTIFKDKEDIYICFVIGLLHDIARFNQWTFYKTFRDTEEFSHAQEAVKLLFTENFIEQFPVEKTYYEIISFAIGNHAALNIDKNEKDKRKILFAKIIRDADKLDIIENSMHKSNVRFCCNFSSEELSKEVLKNFYQNKPINNLLCDSKIDSAVLQLAFIFDLNFDISKSIYLSKKYYKAAYLNFKNHLTQKNKEKLLELTNYVKKYACKKKN